MATFNSSNTKISAAVPEEIADFTTRKQYKEVASKGIDHMLYGRARAYLDDFGHSYQGSVDATLNRPDHVRFAADHKRVMEVHKIGMPMEDYLQAHDELWDGGSQEGRVNHDKIVKDFITSNKVSLPAPTVKDKSSKKKGRSVRKFTGLERDEDPNIHSGLTVVYDEGSGHMIHKQHPDYYHVPAAAENVANHYIRRHVRYGDTEEDHADAVRLFGISKNKQGEWYYDRSRSLLANTPTLGDDMQIPIRSKVWRANPREQGGSFIRRGMKIAHLIANPETICGYDPTGEWSQDPRDQQFHKDNCSSSAHAPGCNIDKKMIGQYKGDNGIVYMAQPLKVMNEAQSFMRDGISHLLAQNKFDVPSYFDLMKSASQYIHGRFNKASDPTPDGRDYHGIKQGAQPWFGQNHINGLMNNVDDSYEVDPGRAKGELHESFKRRLGELRTARYVACFCPYCAIDGQKRLGSQWHDVQHHEAAANSSDKRVVDSYFHLEQDNKGNVVSQGFHLNDLPDDNGSMQEFGERGKRTPHRAFFHDRDFAKTILHYARHNFDEKRTPFGYLRPRMMRVGQIVTKGFSLSPKDIADRLSINPEVSGSGE